MFKVIAPMEKSDGGVWWLRCGNGFRNKDDSLNLYLNCLPVASSKGEIKLQVRELTEEDLRQSAEKRASYSSRAVTSGPGSASASVQNEIPF
jgi:hypothetical protein